MVGPKPSKPHEIDVDGRTIRAFWLLGDALRNSRSRDRALFMLGRCIGNTSGISSWLHAFHEHEDPSSFAISRMTYGGERSMDDAYWGNPHDPLVFQLARAVYDSVMRGDSEPKFSSSRGGTLIFDTEGDQARLSGIRFPLPM